MLEFVGRPNNTHNLVCASMQSSFNNQGLITDHSSLREFNSLVRKTVSSFGGDLYIKR